MIIRIKAIEHCFAVAQSEMPFKVVLTFEKNCG